MYNFMGFFIACLLIRKNYAHVSAPVIRDGMGSVCVCVCMWSSREEEAWMTVTYLHEFEC